MVIIHDHIININIIVIITSNNTMWRKIIFVVTRVPDCGGSVTFWEQPKLNDEEELRFL